MVKNIIIEACIETVEEAKIAEKHGANQLEICSDLAQDGITPSIELVLAIVASVRIPSKIMIRSRSGNFYYNQDELNHMLNDIQKIKTYKVGGFVFGALTRDEAGKVALDMTAIYQICKAAFPYPVTIHKAIDLCDDLLAEVTRLKNISNVKFILTSGGSSDAITGTNMLVEMQKVAGNSIDIIAAGRITKDNLAHLMEATKLKYFHGRKIV